MKVTLSQKTLRIQFVTWKCLHLSSQGSLSAATYGNKC